MAPKPTYEELENRSKKLEEENLRLQRKVDEWREDHKKYSAIFNHWCNCFYIHDLAGNFLDANDAALKLLGYEKDDIPMLNFSSLLEKDDLPKAFELVEETVQTGSHQRVAEFKLKCNGGGYVWVDAGGSLIRKNGKPWAVLGIARDISDRKKAEEELRQKAAQFRHLYEKAPVGIAIADEEGKIIRFNSALLKPGNYKPEEAGRRKSLQCLALSEKFSTISFSANRLSGK